MARSITEIQQSILTQKDATASLSALEVLTPSEQQTLGNLTSTSKVAIWRLWVYIIAVIVWTFEKIQDLHKIEITQLIADNQIGTADWFKNKMLAFQLGYTLSPMLVYDNTDAIEADVLASKIIKQAAVEELAGRLKVKIAKEVIGELTPLTSEELAAAKAYAERIKYAGVKLSVISRVPDDFKCNYTIYYDPLVLDAYGARLDGTDDEPVQTAVKSFLRNLKFNGELSLTKLTDFLQSIEGVEEPVKNSAFAKYGGFPYSSINEYYIADAGYMKLDEENTTFIFLPRGL